MPKYTNETRTLQSIINDRKNNIIQKPPFQRNGKVHKFNAVISMVSLLLNYFSIGIVWIAKVRNQQYILDGQNRINDLIQFVTDPKCKYSYKGRISSEEEKIFVRKYKNKTFLGLSEKDQKKILNTKIDVKVMTCSMYEARTQYYFLNLALSLNRPEKEHSINMYNVLHSVIAEYANNNCMLSHIGSNVRMGLQSLVADLFVLLINKGIACDSKDTNSIISLYRDITPTDTTKLKNKFNHVLEHIQLIFPGDSIKQTRWSQKGDFYTLFQVISFYLGAGRRCNAQVVNQELTNLSMHIGRNENQDCSAILTYKLMASQGNAHESQRRLRYNFLVDRLSKFYTS